MKSADELGVGSWELGVGFYFIKNHSTFGATLSYENLRRGFYGN